MIQCRKNGSKIHAKLSFSGKQPIRADGNDDLADNAGIGYVGQPAYARLALAA